MVLFISRREPTRLGSVDGPYTHADAAPFFSGCCRSGALVRVAAGCYAERKRRTHDQPSTMPDQSRAGQDGGRAGDDTILFVGAMCVSPHASF